MLRLQFEWFREIFFNNQSFSYDDKRRVWAFDRYDRRSFSIFDFSLHRDNMISMFLLFFFVKLAICFWFVYVIFNVFAAGVQFLSSHARFIYSGTFDQPRGDIMYVNVRSHSGVVEGIRGYTPYDHLQKLKKSVIRRMTTSKNWKSRLCAVWPSAITKK